ncbi:uncharacterized protein CTRU02_202550 [Colletotrichum truncatum]|uniref:Uncharacterized protein n=1 Tax=Colletotrichum truncatum TaxID=5467 RepID=A0ACC3ZKL0_COLTU|nr:uncharacterized protein CTRU02_01718 [Colletotrichum truncatum]KAF6800039.1 hypothetical protein CTRU02_01718 [Colletotrichum truncatum]
MFFLHPLLLYSHSIGHLAALPEADEYDPDETVYLRSPPPEGFVPEASRDTAVHVATAAGNLEGFRAIIRSFGRNWRPNELYITYLRAVFFLRNKASNTIFYITARAGRLDIVITIWDCFFFRLSHWVKLSDRSSCDFILPREEDSPEFEDDVDPLYFNILAI